MSFATPFNLPSITAAPSQDREIKWSLRYCLVIPLNWRQFIRELNTWLISVCGEWYANHPQMVQRRFAVWSTHTRIWFANHSRAVCKPFSVLVYTRFNMFQELSVSPSAVNSFKVTNLCENGIHIRKIWRDARFLGSQFGRILLHPQISWWVKN